MHKDSASRLARSDAHRIQVLREGDAHDGCSVPEVEHADIVRSVIRSLFANGMRHHANNGEGGDNQDGCGDGPAGLKTPQHVDRPGDDYQANDERPTPDETASLLAVHEGAYTDSRYDSAAEQLEQGALLRGT